MLNEYSRQWFNVFLETMPEDWTMIEVDGVRRRLPLPDFRRVLDICCGPGRHAAHLVAAGYSITGVDRDLEAIQQAQATVPDGDFLILDQRDLAQLDGPFDAAVILWQSFGYFDAGGNDGVLTAIADLLRPGGRLLLDLFHPGYFETRQGRTTQVRDPRCRAITNRLAGPRLTSTIEYADGATESMDWEIYARRPRRTGGVSRLQRTRTLLLVGRDQTSRPRRAALPDRARADPRLTPAYAPIGTAEAAEAVGVRSG